MANMIALACSAALPTIGSKMTLIKAIDVFNDSDAPWTGPETWYIYKSTDDAMVMEKNMGIRVLKLKLFI